MLYSTEHLFYLQVRYTAFVKVDKDIRDRLSRNLRILMDIAGVENPKQLALLTENQGRDMSYQQTRLIYNGTSAATVDALAHLSAALGVDPYMMLSLPEFLEGIRDEGVSAKDVAELMLLWVNATPEARSTLLHTARLLQPVKPQD